MSGGDRVGGNGGVILDIEEELVGQFCMEVVFQLLEFLFDFSSSFCQFHVLEGTLHFVMHKRKLVQLSLVLIEHFFVEFLESTASHDIEKDK